jgi:Pyruvate/2-oxoacid:ferredoxin oxidoreductase delta subunit
LPRAVLEAEIDRILALGVTFVGSADLAAVEAHTPRIVKTTIYDDGMPVATGAIAAAVHFGRHAAALLDADIQHAVAERAQQPPPVAKDKVLVDHYPRQPRAATTAQTWSPSDAISEAQRCLSCGACFECDNCWKYCPDQAVIRPQEKGQPYRFKLEYCQGCSKCAEQCPSNYIEMR